MTPTQTCPTCRVVLMDGTETTVEAITATKGGERRNIPLFVRMHEPDVPERAVAVLCKEFHSGDLIMSHAIARIIKE